MIDVRLIKKNYLTEWFFTRISCIFITRILFLGAVTQLFLYTIGAILQIPIFFLFYHDLCNFDILTTYTCTSCTSLTIMIN